MNAAAIYKQLIYIEKREIRNCRNKTMQSGFAYYTTVKKRLN